MDGLDVWRALNILPDAFGSAVSLNSHSSPTQGVVPPFLTAEETVQGGEATCPLADS